MKVRINLSRLVFLVTFTFLLILIFYQCSDNGYTKKITRISKKNINDNIINTTNYEFDGISVHEDEINSIIKELLIKNLDKHINVDNFVELREREELHTFLWNNIFGNYRSKDNDILQDYKNILIEQSSFLSQKNQTQLTLDQKLLSTLHKSLYSWVYKNKFSSLNQLILSSKGKGIVICTGNDHFNYARSTIDILRNILNCSLPIEVFYYGDDDLSYENRQILQKYSNTYLSNLFEYFDNTIINVKGWAIKPFAILASRFEEVILMDADVVFVRDPKELFNEQGYIETGTLFFKDRTLTKGKYYGLKWLKLWMKDPLPETKRLRYWKNKTIHEMDSGVVLIHKIKTLLGLLNTCKLNEYEIRSKVVYNYVYGDKETFWIGFDMARQHYYMDPEPSSVLGGIENVGVSEVSSLKMICGHISHTKNGRLLFWNGHIIMDKNHKTDKYKIIKLDAFLIENKKFEYKNGVKCVELDEDKVPILLSDEERLIIQNILKREKEYHFIVPKENN